MGKGDEGGLRPATLSGLNWPEESGLKEERVSAPP